MPPANVPPANVQDVESPLRNAPLRIALIYLGVAALWILFSDAALENIVRENDRTRFFQTLKGLFFVSATAALLYALICRFSRRALALNAQLAASDTKLRALADEVPVALLVVSDGIIAQVNAGAARLFGDGTHASMVGRSILALGLPGRGEELASFLAAASSRVNVLAATPMTLQDLRGREVDVALGLSESCVGKAGSLLLCALDVSERNRLEAQLRHSQKQEVVGQIAAGVAHDFNNLITAILGYAELTGRTLPAGHPGAEHLRELEAAGRQAAGVLGSMLALSRKEPNRRGPVPVASLIDEAVGLVRGMLPANVETRLELPRDLKPLVMGNAVQLKQAILNIASNAKDAMPGGGTLSFEITEIKPAVTFPPRDPASTEEAGSSIRIRIRDTGSGISAENMGRVFEPFFTTKAAGVGTGLGLAITKRIIDDHGGAISVESPAGGGTTFSIELPVVAEGVAGDVAAGVTAETIRAIGRETGVPSARGATGFARVLVVEDDPRILGLLEKWFAQMEWQTTATSDAPGFLAEFERNPGGFDLLVIDHELPTSNGEDVIRAVRSLRSGTPVIAISGGYASGAIDETDLEPIVRLRKPFGFDQLAAAVSGLLKR